MFVDIALAVLALASFIYLLWMLIKKFPLLKNINVESLPEFKAKKQKNIILQNRLNRVAKDATGKLLKMADPLREKAGDRFDNFYSKLKNLEKDLRRRGQVKLSSAVDQSQQKDETITQAKQLINKEEYSEAEELLLDVLNVDQYNVEAYKLLAEIYRDKKEFEQAKETLEYLLKLTHNEDSGIYHTLADVARERGNLKEAEEDYLKSISIKDDNYQHFLSLAEVYEELDDNEQALEMAQRSLILSPNNPKILDFLINISIIMQDRELALQYLDKLREVNPENKKIEEFTASIDQM